MFDIESKEFFSRDIVFFSISSPINSWNFQLILKRNTFVPSNSGNIFCVSPSVDTLIQTPPSFTNPLVFSSIQSPSPATFPYPSLTFTDPTSGITRLPFSHTGPTALEQPTSSFMPTGPHISSSIRPHLVETISSVTPSNELQTSLLPSSPPISGPTTVLDRRSASPSSIEPVCQSTCVTQPLVKLSDILCVEVLV